MGVNSLRSWELKWKLKWTMLLLLLPLTTSFYHFPFYSFTFLPFYLSFDLFAK